MSLKIFHLVFITTSLFLCIFLGQWSYRQYVLFGAGAEVFALGAISLLGSLALFIYGNKFIKKLKASVHA